MRSMILATVLAGLMAASAAADTKQICALIPPDSLGVIALPNIGKSCDAFKETTLYKLFHETELKHLCDAMHTALEEPLAKFDAELVKEVGLPLKEILGLFRGEIGVAIIGLPPGGRGEPRILIVAEYGDKLEAMQALMAKFAESTGGSKDWSVDPPVAIPPVIESSDHGSTKIFVVKRGKGDDARIHAAYAFDNGRVLLAPHPEEIADALDRQAGTKTDSLHDNAAFKAAWAATNAGGEGTTNLGLFVNLEKIWSVLDEQHALPPEAMKALAASGVRDWLGLAAVSRFENGTCADTLYIHTTAPRRGLTAVLVPGLIEDKTALARIPKAAVGWSIGRLDMKGIWDELHRAVKSVDEPTYGKLTEAIAQFEERCGGVKVADYLASYGTTWMSHSRMPAVGLLPQGIVQLQLANPDAFLAGIKGMAKGMGFEMVSATYEGREVYHLQAPLGQLGGNPFESFQHDPYAMLRMFAMMMPTHFYVDGGWAVFGNLHQDLCDHIDLGAYEGLSNATVPEGAVCYGEGNAAPVLIGAYNTLLPMAGSLEGILRTAGVPFDSRYMPRASTLLKFLSRPSTMGILASEQGVTLRATGDLNALPMVAGGVGIGAAMLLGLRAGPPMERRRPMEAPRVVEPLPIPREEGAGSDEHNEGPGSGS